MPKSTEGHGDTAVTALELCTEDPLALSRSPDGDPGHSSCVGPSSAGSLKCSIWISCGDPHSEFRARPRNLHFYQVLQTTRMQK